MSDRIDLVAIGGSAGSFTALKTILGSLHPHLPAALVVCQHRPIGGTTSASELLQPFCALPLADAEDGTPIEHGRVYFAPQDTHLMIGRDHLHLRRGAHENNFRPAIDPLFRSAAIYRATRAVGLVLSGMLNDGAAGARALERVGANILIQSPETADFPEMPQAAQAAAPSAETVPLAGIADRITRMAGQPCAKPGPIPTDIGLELRIAGLEGASMENERKLGELSPYNCPHCNGVLWEIEDGPLMRYRCHTGHAYSIEALAASQEEALDKSLFDALRAHRGRGALLRRMAARSAAARSRDFYEARAALVDEDAERLEQIIARRQA